MPASRILPCLVVACLWATEARAEWLVTPFGGITFGATTSFPSEPGGLGRKFTLGGSFAQLGDGWLGAEGDLSYVSRFFERGDGPEIIAGSGVTTLTGNVLVAIPRRITKESLRPYLVGGFGLVHPRIDYVSNGLEQVESNLFGFDFGGGALGEVTQRSSVRFDLRYFRSLSADDAATLGATRLAFWRLSIGVTLRY